MHDATVKFFKKTWKNQISFMQERNKISMQHAKCLQNSLHNNDTTYQKTFSECFHTLLHLSKVVLAIYDLATNNQK